MNLRDILACPTCRTAVERVESYLRCCQCGCEYPIIDGVPIMLPGGEYTDVEYEFELTVGEEYAPWLHRMILQSLTDGQVVVDAGSGNMAVDDPCIIRTDIKLTPYVDLVADLHALPFLPNSVDYILALAVFEHLRQPFTVAEEIHTVLKPGGYVYAESNFVYAYHGYPHHYYNISIQGLQQIFSRFTELKVGVAPYQMPGFALEFILGTYLSLFKAETPTEAEFAALVRDLLEYPLYQYDNKFTQDMAFRVAAGDYLIGIKQPNGDDTIIPQPILDVYASTPELRARYPHPNNIFEPDNLMFWAKNEGRRLYPEIAAYFETSPLFSKYLDSSRAFDRSVMNSLPPIPTPGTQWFTDHRRGLGRRRNMQYLLNEARFHYRRGGLGMLWKESWAFLKRRAGFF